MVKNILRLVGIEPTTYGTEIRRSIQIKLQPQKKLKINLSNDPTRIVITSRR